MDITFAQLAGSITGGLVGGLAGFIGNNIHQRILERQVRRNVACALRAEITTLSERIEAEYLDHLLAALKLLNDEARYPARSFSGQREYSQIYRSLGQHIGLLPNDLVCELVSWYTSLTVSQERASELRDLVFRKDTELLPYAISLAKHQHDDFSALVRQAVPLVKKLGKF